MPYEMPTVSRAPITGRGRVQKARDPKNGDIYWRVTMSVWDKAKKIAVEVAPFNVAVGQAPKYLTTKLDWTLTVSNDKTKILSAVPDRGIFICEFARIVSEKEKPPSPRVQASSYKADEPWATFAIVYKVVDGEFTGLEITDFLNYNFTYVQDPVKPERRLAAFEGNGDATKKLAARMNALGVVDKGPIAWKGEAVLWRGASTKWVNILPVIQKRARQQVEENNRRVEVQLAEGKVATVNAILGDDEIWEGDAETPKAAEETVDVIDQDAGDATHLETVGDNAPKVETLPEDGEIEWAESEEDSEE